jgi:hypothetical protein
MQIARRPNSPACYTACVEMAQVQDIFHSRTCNDNHIVLLMSPDQAIDQPYFGTRLLKRFIDDQSQMWIE